MMNPPIPCHICGTPLHSFIQPALSKGKSDRRMVECHTVDCMMWMQTFSSENYPNVDLTLYGQAVTT